jgi:hypothetical protein
MRLGPGKHLKGLTLMGGIVKPEEYNYFHEVNMLFTKHFFAHSHDLVTCSSFSILRLRGLVREHLWTAS